MSGVLILVVAVLVLLVPAQALADDALADAAGDVVTQVTRDVVTQPAADAVDVVPVPSPVPDPVEVVDQVTDAVGTTTNQVTDAVDTTTNQVTDAVDTTTNQVTDAVDTSATDVTQSVGDATQDVAGSVGDMTNDMTGVDASSVLGTGRGDPSGPFEKGSGTVSEGVERRAITARMSPAPAPMRSTAVAQREAWHASLAQSSAAPSTGAGPPDDPCENAAGVVCLGLLYGLGAFADAGTMVLGLLAVTGLGVVVLVLLALGFFVAGSGALAAARRRSVAVAD